MLLYFQNRLRIGVAERTVLIDKSPFAVDIRRIIRLFPLGDIILKKSVFQTDLSG